ncbi:MAG: hypothetical protein EA402_13310 [Planctomycetota bacterium]|nr:MAG: hypothetical protein EA402_13310 [Planctomycetota bacterium]
MTTTITPQQLAEMLSYQLTAIADHAQATALPPLMIWGAPGVGKSSVVAQVCAQHGVGLIDVRLAQREPVDMRGLPVPDGDTVRWLPSAEWPRDPDSRGIILFDELTAADRSLQVAAYEFILDRRLGDLYRVPDGWVVVAAGNRVEDHAVSAPLSSALANRFAHVELDPTVEDWASWAVAAQVEPVLIAFVRFRPDLLLDQHGDLSRGWPSPRSWARVGRIMADRDRLSPVVQQALISGLVGEAAAAELNAFLDWAGDAPDIHDLLRSQGRLALPKRADQRHALCAAAVHHLPHMPDRLQVLGRFIALACALPADLAAMMMADALRVFPADLVTAMMAHRQWQRWQEGHGRHLQEGSHERCIVVA